MPHAELDPTLLPAKMGREMEGIDRRGGGLGERLGKGKCGEEGKEDAGRGGERKRKYERI